MNGGSVEVHQCENGLKISMDASIVTDQSVVGRVVELTLDRDAWEMLPKKVISTTDFDPRAVERDN